MAENSKISWTDHLIVLCFVAIITERQPVRYVKAQLREIGERFDVVRSQVAASVVPAHLAGKPVPQKNVISPTFVFLAESCISAFSQFAIFIAMAGLSANRFISSSVAYFLPLFEGARAAPVIIATPFRSAHFAAISECLTFHWMNPSRISLAVSPHQFHFFGARHG